MGPPLSQRAPTSYRVFVVYITMPEVAAQTPTHLKFFGVPNKRSSWIQCVDLFQPHAWADFM